MSILRWSLTLLIGVTSIFALGCKPVSGEKYNFNKDRYADDISFFSETIIHSRLAEQFMTKGDLPVSNGFLDQRRVMEENHQVESGIHVVIVEKDYSETKREYKSGVKFPFYGQVTRVDCPLQGKTLERVHKDAIWTPFSLPNSDDSCDVISALEAFNLEYDELSISFPDEKIGIGYAWSQTNSIVTSFGKVVTFSYRVKFESIEQFSGSMCAKFGIHQVRTEVSEHSKLTFDSRGCSYYSVEYNLAVASAFEFDASYREVFEKDGEEWCMTRVGNGTIKENIGGYEN